MFEDLKEQLNNFHDLSTDEQEKLFAEISKRGRADRETFESYLSALDFGEDSYKDIFYEAFWRESKGFDDIIFKEIKQLIDEAEAGNEGANERLTALFYLAELKDMPDDFYEKSLNFYLEKLDSSVAEVRSNCQDAIIDVINASGKKITENQISKIQKMLYDDDFKVKVYTYSNLKDMNAVPKDFKFSFFDKIRGRLAGYSNLMKSDSSYKKE